MTQTRNPARSPGSSESTAPDSDGVRRPDEDARLERRRDADAGIESLTGERRPRGGPGDPGPDDVPGDESADVQEDLHPADGGDAAADRPVVDVERA